MIVSLITIVFRPKCVVKRLNFYMIFIYLTKHFFFWQYMLYYENKLKITTETITWLAFNQSELRNAQTAASARTVTYVTIFNTYLIGWEHNICALIGWSTLYVNKAKRTKQRDFWVTHSSCFLHRLWGTVNILYCHRCGDYFPCTELGHCIYHPMAVNFGNMECTATKIVGVYPCCQQRVLHFDPSLETSVSFLVVLMFV